MLAQLFTDPRVTLLLHLAAALGHSFLLEQPGMARFGHLPRWRVFVEEIAYVPLAEDCSCDDYFPDRYNGNQYTIW